MTTLASADKTYRQFYDELVMAEQNYRVMMNFQEDGNRHPTRVKLFAKVSQVPRCPGLTIVVSQMQKYGFRDKPSMVGILVHRNVRS